MLRLPFRQLHVWEKGVTLATDIYLLTKGFPHHDLYGLTRQMRESAVSVPSNIAEGSQRSSNKEFAHFLRISKGSLAELETQLVIAIRIGYCTEQQGERFFLQIQELSKMIRSLIQRVTAPSKALPTTH